MPKRGCVTERGGPEAGTVEMHYRVTLDIRVLVRALTDEVCRESFFFNDKRDSAGEPYFRENVERQRRLYELLRSNLPALDEYLLSVVTQEAVRFASDGLMHAFDTKDEDELLISLYKSMPEEDVRFFEECRRMGALAENTELIATAFKVEWTGARVEEMGRRIEGDVRRAEVVEQTLTRLVRKLNS